MSDAEPSHTPPRESSADKKPNNDVDKTNMEAIVKQGEDLGKPDGPSDLGIFKSNINGKMVDQEATSVFVLVVHYDFKGDKTWIRECDEPDMTNLKETFVKNRDCNFRELYSPKKDILLDFLSDQEKILRFFSSSDVPDAFVLIVLSHGHEDGKIYTNEWCKSQSNYDYFTTDEIFGCIKQLDKFEKCLKLVIFGPCRGELKERGKINGGKSCRITSCPDLHNLVVFFSTVEETVANTSDKGSWLVQKLCDCLNRTEEMTLLKFLTIVQNSMHYASRDITNFTTNEYLGQTPEVKMFTQDREFYISKKLIAKVPTPNTSDVVIVKENDGRAPTYSNSYNWMSDSGENIRGRQAFILYEYDDENTKEMRNALRQNLDFVIKPGSYSKLNQTNLRTYLQQKCSGLDHDVGCVLTCIFGKVTEKKDGEVCVLVGQEEIPITKIVLGFIGPMNDKWIGKPKIFILVDQESQTTDSVEESSRNQFGITATNNSGWLVLVVKHKDVLRSLIGLLEGRGLKKGKSLQQLLSTLLTTETNKNSVMLNSTMQFLLDFPDWPRCFVKQHFKLWNRSEPMAKIGFDKLLGEVKTFIQKSQFWILSSVAGAGKTTVLKEIAYQLAKSSDAELKILFISLMKHCSSFGNKNESEIKVVATVTQNSPDDIKSWIEEKKIHIFFDGFDEVPQRFKNKVLLLLKALKDKNVSFCVASRTHEVNAIGKIMSPNVVHVEIEPLDEKQQAEFLRVVVGKNEDECKQFMKDFRDIDIKANPLHLSLLAESKEKKNLFLIYDNVVDKKMEQCLGEREGYNKDHVIFKSKLAEAEECLQLISLRSLMNETPIGPDVRKEDLEKMNDFGVATVLNGEVTFLHQTFAEFLATKRFLSKIDGKVSDSEDESGKRDAAMFHNNNFSQCRKFLDSYYCSLTSEEEIEKHTNVLLSNKALDPKLFLKRVAEDNLRQIFTMIKTRISFCKDREASLHLAPDAELLTSAVGNQEIAVQLLEMGVLDPANLRESLPNLLLQIEQRNAVAVLEKMKVEIPDLQGIVNACYSDGPELGASLQRVGFTAIRENQSEMLKMLVQIGIRVNEASEKNENALYMACRYGRIECVEVLLKSGARKAMLGETLHDPLILALENKHLKLAKFLQHEEISGIKRWSTWTNATSL